MIAGEESRQLGERYATNPISNKSFWQLPLGISNVVILVYGPGSSATETTSVQVTAPVKKPGECSVTSFLRGLGQQSNPALAVTVLLRSSWSSYYVEVCHTGQQAANDPLNAEY